MDVFRKQVRRMGDPAGMWLRSKYTAGTEEAVRAGGHSWHTAD